MSGNSALGWGYHLTIGQRMQQRAAALARNAGATRAAPSMHHHTNPHGLTMNQTIQNLTTQLADLKDQHAAVAAQAAADITQAERAAAQAYQDLLDAIADGRTPRAEAEAHQAAQAALQTAKLQSDVGEVRAARLAAEIEDTTEELAHETEARRRRLIAALEQARNELEADMVEMTERRFEAEARGLQINARLHQLRGSPGVVDTVPLPYAHPVLRPITLDNPAPAPIFPSMHRREVLARIGAEVAQIGADL